MKNLRLEIQAIRLAQKINNNLFSHVFGGAGYLSFSEKDITHPILVVNIGKAGKFIYEAVKQHPVEFYYKSYTKMYGSGIVPRELIDRAYYQCELDEKGRLTFKLDFDNSENSLNKKYQGKPEVRLMDDFVFKDEQMSLLLPAFFHLFNTRLKNKNWTVMAVSMQYNISGKKLTFNEFNGILKSINVIN